MPKYVVEYRWVETVYVEADSAKQAEHIADKRELDYEALSLDPFGTVVRLATPAEVEACEFETEAYKRVKS
jgi:hypothetical protein